MDAMRNATIQDDLGNEWTRDEVIHMHETGDAPHRIQNQARARFIGDDDACISCQMNGLNPTDVHTETP